MSPHTKQFILSKNIHRQSYQILSLSTFDTPIALSAYESLPFNPADTIIVFDLQGVLFRCSISKIIKILLHCPHKVRLCTLIFNFPIIFDCLKVIFHKQVIEQFILHLAKKYNYFAPIKETALAICNAQTPIRRTVNLLHKLHAKGFKLMAFSNMGELSINALRLQYPEIFKHFTNILCSQKKDGYIAKPSSRAFKKLLNLINDQRKKVIFIDDTFDNIKQAQSNGMYVIPFSNSSSLEEILTQLRLI